MIRPVGRHMSLYNAACEVVLYDCDGDPADILDECESIAQDVQDMLNMYDPASELSRLNRACHAGAPCRVSAPLYALLKRIDAFSALCGGAFDVTLGPLIRLWNIASTRPQAPDDLSIAAALRRCGYRCLRYDDRRHAVTFSAPGMSIDVGGVGKGYAVEAVADHLRRRGVRSASVNFGGELFVLGGGPTKAGLWRIGVRRPWTGGALGRLNLRDTAVATSGGDGRFFRQNGHLYHHILDPRTGHPAENDLTGVTIVCGDPVLAEMMSTAFYVLGAAAGADLVQKVSVQQPVFYLAVNGRGIDMSPALRSRFEPYPFSQD